MKTLEQIVKKFNKSRILVIGDLILDEFIWGDVERISPEAPVPVVWAKQRTFMPGGAANVANNITALEGSVSLVGVVGDDSNASILLPELKKRKIKTEGIFIEPQRHTTVKTRIVAGHQQVVRVDWEHKEPLPKKLNLKILKFIEKNIDKFDAVIIEDYGKGVINTHLVEGLVSFAGKNKKIITVDPKEENFEYYHHVTAITPNRRELGNAVRHLKIKDTQNRFRINSDRLLTDKDINSAAGQVLKYLELESLLVTLGECGMRLYEKNGRITPIPTVAQEVFDVSGAGDTVVACFTMALSCGADKLEAAYIANSAAGIVVGKLGTATTTRSELIGKIKTLAVR